MTTVDDDRIRGFLADEARRAVGAAPSLDEAVGRLAPHIAGRPSHAPRRLIVLMAAALLLVAALGTAIAVGSGILRLPVVVDDPETGPISDLGIFAPVAGRIVYGDGDGIWGLDPTAPADASSRIQVSSETGTPLGWSTDGTELLIVRQSGALQDPGRLIVLHADGSETLVAERPAAIQGATISADGSRVVFATGSALYAVDALGGAELIVDGNGRVEEPSFSPDGMRIAYVDGSGDNSHHVMVIGADGSNAQEIGFLDCACHVYGLAWSPAGDKIAIALEGTISTFGIDGSDLTEIAGADTTCGPSDPCAVKLPRSADAPYWSPDGARIAYTTGCVQGTAQPGREGCHLAITDANGSNLLEFGYGASGPWHPGTLLTRGSFTTTGAPSG